jgi:hypothetical protein
LEKRDELCKKSLEKRDEWCKKSLEKRVLQTSYTAYKLKNLRFSCTCQKKAVPLQAESVQSRNKQEKHKEKIYGKTRKAKRWTKYIERDKENL